MSTNVETNEFEGLRAQAHEVLRSGDAHAALALFRRAEEIKPGDVENTIDFGDALLLAGQSGEAARTFATLLSRQPVFLNLLRGLGRLALVDNDPEMAASCWHLVWRFAPTDRWAGHHYAASLARTRREAAAEEVFGELLTRFPDFMPPRRGRGHIDYSRGNHASALEWFEQALQLAPDDLTTLFDCVRQCLLLQDAAMAKKYLERTLRLAPEDSRSVGFQAQLETLEREMAVGSAACVRQAQESEPTPSSPGTSFRGHRLLGALALEDKAFELALSHFNAAKALNLEDPANLLDISRCLIALRRTGEAEQLVTALCAREPGAAMAYAMRADIAHRRGDVEVAASMLDEAAALGPEDCWVRNELGHLEVALGRLEMADAHFAFVLARDPSFFHALRGMGAIAKARGCAKEAIGFFERAIALRPGDLWMRWEVASLKAKGGARREAEALFRAIIADDPSFPPAYRSLVPMLLQDGQSEAALKLSRSALAHASCDAWHRYDLTKALQACGAEAEARELLMDLAKQGPAQSAAALDLFYMLRRRGDKIEARTFLDLGFRAAPSDHSLLIAKAAALLDEGQFDEAEAIFAGLPSGGGTAYWRSIGLGQVARGRGAYKEALQLLLEAIELAPEHPAAYGEICALVSSAEEAAVVIAQIDAWIGLLPDNQAAWRQKAHFLRQQYDHEGAAVVLRTMMEKWPDDPDVLVDLAQEEDRLGNPKQAEDLLGRAAALAPDHPALLEGLARRAEWCDDFPLALNLVRRALTAAPSRGWLGFAVVRLMFLTGDSAGALATLEEMEARGGIQPEGAFLRVDILKQRGRLVEAAEHSAAARLRFPRHFRLFAQGVSLDAELGRLDEARRSLDEARPANQSEAAGVQFLKGFVEMSGWRLDLARDRIAAAFQSNTDDCWFLNRLIHCDLIRLDLDAAARGLETLGRLNFAANKVKGRSVSVSQSHYGQLLDEFRLDPMALSEVKSARALSDPQARLAALRDALRAYPDYTPAAIAFLLECRLQGELDWRDPLHVGAIPQHIMQFWDTAEMPDDLRTYCASWPEAHPQLRYTRYDEESAADFLAINGFSAALRAFMRAEQPAMRADIFRLAFLYRKGGIYVDADDRCQKSISPLLSGCASLVLYQEDLGSVGNNFIIAAPEHPVIKRALDKAVEAINQGACDLLWLATGPGLLTRAVCSFVAEDEISWREKLAQIRVLDRPEMLSYSAIHCHSAYKVTERHWS